MYVPKILVLTRPPNRGFSGVVDGTMLEWMRRESVHQLEIGPLAADAARELVAASVPGGSLPAAVV